MGPLGPFGCDGATGGDGSIQFGGCSAVAFYFCVGDGHGRVVIGPLALNAGWRGRGAETCITWKS